MSAQGRNTGTIAEKHLANIAWKKFAIVVSEWNEEVTESLFQSAFDTLIEYGVKKENIIRRNVPGSFELSFGAQLCAQENSIDAIICLGCIIQGETRHFEFICQSVAQGLKDVSLKFNKPVIFGVLTTDSKQQAFERAGGKLGNKGEESAIAAIKMLGLIKDISNIKS
jgi:6,7-dimethyl-8-ribityllumazine synthase